MRRPSLLTLFLDAAHEMVVEMVERIAREGFAGLRPAHSRLFENLDRHGTRLGELAERAQMTRQSMSELVTAMERAGYVAREQDPLDLRARIIRLTPRGREMIRASILVLEELQDEWLARLGRGPLSSLPQALERALGQAPELPAAAARGARRR
jgi:DNA-binding MarR family transcriptional regulator